MTHSTGDSTPALLAVRTREELLALRERRRSQFSAEPEEFRLSFINECSGAEDRSESTLPQELSQVGPTDPQPSTSSFHHPVLQPPGLSHHPSNSTSHSFVAARSTKRQELMSPFSQTSQPRGHESLSHQKMGELTAFGETAQELCPQVQTEAEGDKSQDSFATEAPDEHPSDSFDDQASESFSVPNRAMSELHESPSSDSCDSDDNAQESEISKNHYNEIKQNRVFPPDKKPHVLSQRQSKKQRRTSLTPLHILETVSPAVFSLPPINFLPKESLTADHDAKQAGKSLGPRPVGLELTSSVLNPLLLNQQSSSKRRDSGMTKEEKEAAEDVSPSNPDEGWEKRPIAKKKRARAELGAVSEEQPFTAAENEAGIYEQLSSATSNLSGAGPREARRARKEVNYTLPSLNKKMRRPESSAPSDIKRKSSITSKNAQNPTAIMTTSTIRSTASKKPQLTLTIKSTGATPSTVNTSASNTSCSTTNTNTSHTLSSSPLSSSSSHSCDAQVELTLIPPAPKSQSIIGNQIETLNKNHNQNSDLKQKGSDDRTHISHKKKSKNQPLLPSD